MTNFRLDVNVNEARAVLARAYKRAVESLAEECIEEMYDRPMPVKLFRDDLAERVQDHDWVKLTEYARELLSLSSHPDAGVKECTPDSFKWHAGMPWSQLAFHAMVGDVEDALKARGIDLTGELVQRAVVVEVTV